MINRIINAVSTFLRRRRRSPRPWPQSGG